MDINMILEDLGIVKILKAKEGYKLYSPILDEYFDKIYLGKNDSPNKYIVIEDTNKDEIKNEEVKVLKEDLETTKERLDNCEEMLDISLCATDEIYTMIAPLIGDTLEYPTDATIESVGLMTLYSDNTISDIQDIQSSISILSDSIGEMYVLMVKRGLKAVDEVPLKYRDYVNSKI